MSFPGGPRLAFLLTGAMAVSTVMQFAIGALGPLLRDDLDLSRPQLGLLGAVFNLVAAALSVAIGRRIDAIGARVALTAVFAGAGAAMLLASVAPSFALLMLALVPGGAIAAAGNPATNKVIAGLPGPRGALTGMKQSGVQVGALAAGGLLPPLAAGLGWRVALGSLGAASLAGVALVRWLPEARAEELEEPAAHASRELSRAIRRLGLYAFCMGVGMSAIQAFLPLYGAERLGLGDATAGALLAVIAVGGIFSRVAWAASAERRAGAGHGTGAPLPLLAVAAVAATALVAAAETLGAWTLWTGAALLGLSAAAWNAVAMLTLLAHAPPGAAGHSSGRMLTAFFLGLGVSAPVFGAIVDATGDYLAGWALTGAAFVAAAVVARPFARDGGATRPQARARARAGWSARGPAGSR